jgi:hypothetical protein
VKSNDADFKSWNAEKYKLRELKLWSQSSPVLSKDFLFNFLLSSNRKKA